MADHGFTSYEEFWPWYVAMHSRRATRWLHLIGTTSGAIIAIVGLVTSRWFLLPALPMLGYGFAWPSHWLVERNNPASFGHPAWSFRGDLSMIGRMLAGKDRELMATAAEWLRQHPEDRSPGSAVAQPNAA
jgi:hypothetical protein